MTKKDKHIVVDQETLKKLKFKTIEKGEKSICNLIKKELNL